MAYYNEFLGILVVALSINLFYKWRGGNGSESSSSSHDGDDGEGKQNNSNNTNSTADDEGKTTANNPLFQQFQRQFIVVYLMMMAADWLQGPYVYELYQHYGFTRADNGVLFIAGFGSSLIFGTWAGPLADRYGRRFCCLLYGVTYTLSCMTKHFPNFGVLMVGRLLGGFATSILWSAFESWMVSEHNNRKFPAAAVEGTFGLMYTLNGLIAIGSGFVAQWAVALYGHPVAPFDASAALLILGSIFIFATWPENYGNESIPLTSQFAEAIAAIKKDKNVFVVGLMQALFEGAMYTFVFLWTPALDSGNNGKIPHGLIFSSFMTASSLGGSLFGFLVKKGGLKQVMIKVFAGAVATMAIPVLTADDNLIMIGFILFEIIVGIFWPCIGSLRAQYVPESCRATVTNVFRIPLNIIVCCVLMLQGSMTVAVTFLVCVALHGAGLYVASTFVGMTDAPKASASDDGSSAAPSAVAARDDNGADEGVALVKK